MRGAKTTEAGGTIGKVPSLSFTTPQKVQVDITTNKIFTMLGTNSIDQSKQYLYVYIPSKLL